MEEPKIGQIQPNPTVKLKLTRNGTAKSNGFDIVAYDFETVEAAERHLMDSLNAIKRVSDQANLHFPVS